MINKVESLVAELEALVWNVAEHLQQTGYEELEALSDRRERILLTLLECEAEVAEQHKQRLRKLSQYDERIVGRMQDLKQEARDWLIKRETIKEQRSAYDAHYAAGSMFIDRRN